MACSYPPYLPTGSQGPPPAYTPYPQQQGSSGAAQMPSSKVELHVSCRKLLDMDVFSKSDPIVVLFTLGQNKNEWREFGRTEIIWNNLNPDFAKSFVMDYFFEEVQRLKFEVYDVDSASSDLSQHDFLGSMECSLGSIFGEHNGRFETYLKNPKQSSCGKIIVSAEEVSSCRDVVTLQFCGKKLDKKDFFGKSDPFLAISRCNEDNSYTVVHRTEVKKSTLNPSWLPFSVTATMLCNGDYDSDSS